MAAETRQALDDNGLTAAEVGGIQAGVAAACLRKMKCLPGSDMDHGPALRGLAAIGRGEAPAAGDAPSAISLVELEAALCDAGSALLEQAGLLAGQHERGGVCAALQYLSFRCFCAVDVLHQAVSGVSADAVPEGDALWGAIVGAWGSVRSGVNVEGALADLASWWQGFREADVDVTVESGPLTHDTGGEAAADAALAGMWQQAEWLRGEAAGDLRSESAAEHLESAASAVGELCGLLGCAPVMSGRKVKAVVGLDLSGGLECMNGKGVSVYSGRVEIVDGDIGGASDVEQWAASVEAGATALATSVGAVKRGEAARIAHGLPRMVQIPRRAAMMHSCVGSRPDEPLGVLSCVTVQVQCEAGWPLRVFLEDEAWGDVGLEVKQRVAVRVLGVCAVAEACGVDVGGMGVGSFVVVGVGSGTVGDLVGALDGGGCEVVLSACGGVWGKHRSDGGSGDRGVSSVLLEVLGVGGDALGGGSGVVSSFVGSGEGDELGLTKALEVLARGGSGCCMTAYAFASSMTRFGVNRTTGVGPELGGFPERHGVHLVDASGRRLGFVAACRNGDAARVRELLALAGDRPVDVYFGREGTLAHGFEWACFSGHVEVVRELLVLTGHRAVDVHAGPEGIPEYGFRAACQNGHLDVVRELLALTGAREVDVHAADEHGPEAAFRAACANGHVSIVRLLVGLTGAREVDVHVGDWLGPEAAFRWTCFNGHLGVVRELLALSGPREVDVHAGSESEPEAGFLAACENGHEEVVRELLTLTGDRAIHVNIEDADGPGAGFRRACRNNHLGVVLQLLALVGGSAVGVHAHDKHGLEAAFRASCARGFQLVVGVLLALTDESEVDVHAADAWGHEAAFRWACFNGHVEIVRTLLALSGHREVGVHAEFEGKPEAGFRLACENGHSEVVRELLDLTGHRAVDVHVADEDGPEASFRWACFNGHLDVVRELLALDGLRQVDVHAGPEGEPELGFRLACANGHAHVVRELLTLTGAREVDVHAGPVGEPEDGFRLACERGHESVVRELLGLTGQRAIPASAREEGGAIAVQAAKDVV